MGHTRPVTGSLYLLLALRALVMLLIAVIVFSVRVVEFLCTHFGPVSPMCSVTVRDTGSPARVGISILMYLSVLLGFSNWGGGWIIPHSGLVLLPWPTPIIYREGTGSLVTWLPLQIDRAGRPHIRVSSEQRGCVNRGMGFLLVGVLALEFVCWQTAVQLVEALRYKPKGRGFDSWSCHWSF